MATDRTEHRKWQGIFISADIWLSPLLDMNAKGILVEVDSLTHFGRDGICTKTNKDFTCILGCSKKTITRTIDRLVEDGLLLCDVVQSAGNERSLLVDYEGLGKYLGLVFVPGSLCTFGGRYGQNVLAVAPDRPETYGQNAPRSINKNRSNRGKVTGGGKLPDREAAALDGFVDACSQLELIVSKEFICWFGNEIRGRWPVYKVTRYILSDWYDKIYMRFGEDTATAAAKEYAVSLKTNKWEIPLGKIVEIATKIYGDNKRNMAKLEEQKQKQAVQEERSTGSVRPFAEYKEMDDDELVKRYLASNKFCQGQIERRRPDVIDLVKLRRECAV